MPCRSESVLYDCSENGKKLGDIARGNVSNMILLNILNTSLLSIDALTTE